MCSSLHFFPLFSSSFLSLSLLLSFPSLFFFLLLPSHLLQALTGTRVKASGSAPAPAPVPSTMGPTKVGKYGDVAPAAREAYDPKFGKGPQNAMEKGQRPGDFRLESDPHYPFGPDKSSVGEADELQDYLDDLENKLEGVKTYHERHREISAQLPRGMKLGKMPVTVRNVHSTNDSSLIVFGRAATRKSPRKKSSRR